MNGTLCLLQGGIWSYQTFYRILVLVYLLTMTNAHPKLDARTMLIRATGTGLALMLVYSRIFNSFFCCFLPQEHIDKCKKYV